MIALVVTEVHLTAETFKLLKWLASLMGQQIQLWSMIAYTWSRQAYSGCRENTRVCCLF